MRMQVLQSDSSNVILLANKWEEIFTMVLKVSQGQNQNIKLQKIFIKS